MINKKTATILSSVFIPLFLSSSIGYCTEQNIFEEAEHRNTTFNKESPSMSISYPEDVLRDAEVIIGGSIDSTEKLKGFAMSLNEQGLINNLYTRQITDKDRIMSYALQLVGQLEENKEDYILLFRKAWLLNPENAQAAQFIGTSRQNFGDFIDIVKAYEKSR